MDILKAPVERRPPDSQPKSEWQYAILHKKTENPKQWFVAVFDPDGMRHRNALLRPLDGCDTNDDRLRPGHFLRVHLTKYNNCGRIMTRYHLYVVDDYVVVKPLAYVVTERRDSLHSRFRFFATVRVTALAANARGSSAKGSLLRHDIFGFIIDSKQMVPTGLEVGTRVDVEFFLAKDNENKYRSVLIVDKFNGLAGSDRRGDHSAEHHQNTISNVHHQQPNRSANTTFARRSTQPPQPHNQQHGEWGRFAAPQVNQMPFLKAFPQWILPPMPPPPILPLLYSDRIKISEALERGSGNKIVERYALVNGESRQKQVWYVMLIDDGITVRVNFDKMPPDVHMGNSLLLRVTKRGTEYGDVLMITKVRDFMDYYLPANIDNAKVFYTCMCVPTNDTMLSGKEVLVLYNPCIGLIYDLRPTADFSLRGRSGIFTARITTQAHPSKSYCSIFVVRDLCEASPMEVARSLQQLPMMSMYPWNPAFYPTEMRPMPPSVNMPMPLVDSSATYPQAAFRARRQRRRRKCFTLKEFMPPSSAKMMLEHRSGSRTTIEKEDESLSDFDEGERSCDDDAIVTLNEAMQKHLDGIDVFATSPDVHEASSPGDWSLPRHDVAYHQIVHVDRSENIFSEQDVGSLSSQDTPAFGCHQSLWHQSYETRLNTTEEEVCSTSKEYTEQCELNDKEHVEKLMELKRLVRPFWQFETVTQAMKESSLNKYQQLTAALFG